MSTTCLFDETENDFVWDVEDERLQCTPAIGFIIGGIAKNYEYINEVNFHSKMEFVFQYVVTVSQSSMNEGEASQCRECSTN